MVKAGLYKGQLYIMDHGRHHYLHMIIELTINMNLMVNILDKLLISREINGSERQQITILLPKHSSHYTIELKLAGEWDR